MDMAIYERTARNCVDEGVGLPLPKIRQMFCWKPHTGLSWVVGCAAQLGLSILMNNFGPMLNSSLGNVLPSTV